MIIDQLMLKWIWFHKNSRKFSLAAPDIFIHLQVWDNFIVLKKNNNKDKQTKMAGAERPLCPTMNRDTPTAKHEHVKWRSRTEW